MPRTLALQGTADVVYLSGERQPIFKIELFDARQDSLQAVVLNKYQQIPLDITDQTVSASVTEDIGFGTENTAQLTIKPDDTINRFHFFSAFVRISLSDRRLVEQLEADFFSIFLGPIVGQPGYELDVNGKNEVITITAYSRGVLFNRRKTNSPRYLQGTDLGTVALDIATNARYGMGLDRDEVLFGLQGKAIGHTQIAIRDEDVVSAMNKVLFPVNKTVRFNGNGKLSTIDMDFAKAPVRKYNNSDVIISLNWPGEQIDVVNVVRVIGLDKNLTKIVHPTQVTNEFEATIGYFERKYEKNVFYTDDRRGRVVPESVFISKKNVNGFFTIIKPRPSVKAIDDFHCRVTIKTPYLAIIFFIWLVIYIILIAIAHATSGYWQAALAVIAAAWLAFGLVVMQNIGIVQVEISGKFFEMVYKELSAEAIWSTNRPDNIRRKEIRNHVIDNISDLKAIAKRELIKEKVKATPREIRILEDTVLEPGDIIETEDGSRFFIINIQRELNRAYGTSPVMTIRAWKIRDGKEYRLEAGPPLF